MFDSELQTEGALTLKALADDESAILLGLQTAAEMLGLCIALRFSNGDLILALEVRPIGLGLGLTILGLGQEATMLSLASYTESQRCLLIALM